MNKEELLKDRETLISQAQQQRDILNQAHEQVAASQVNLQRIEGAVSYIDAKLKNLEEAEASKEGANGEPT